jgi:heme oxygenase (mycobilin-producing)
MHIVMNRITAAEGKAQEFEDGFTRSMRDTLPGVPGLLRSTLLKPKEPTDPYLSTMEFVDQESFLAWVKSEAFRVAHDVAVDTTAASTIEIYSVLEEVTND